MSAEPSDEELDKLYLHGGLPLGPDGRVHTVFRHDPNTLRLSSAAPNMQNLPRGGTELQDLVRGFVEAPEGYEFWAVDFSGIEAVLVGFFANAPRVMRIFKLDGHSYFTAYAIYELQKEVGLTYADLPQEGWSDADLRACLGGFKKRFPQQRNTNKKITHGANYLETAKMAQVILLDELGVLMPVKEIQKVLDFYHDLFPEIGRWHTTLTAKVGGARNKIPDQCWGFEAKNTYIRQPFGLVNRFYDVVKWEKTPAGWDWSFGEEAKRLASFLPQSTARFILTRASQRIWDQHPEVAATFRMYIHDELLGEAISAEVAHCLLIAEEALRQPIPELKLPDGTLLELGTESKRGRIWGRMQ